MTKKTITKAEKLANSLIDSKLEEENQKFHLDPLTHLRNTTAAFINKRFEKIEKDIELEEITMKALKSKMENNPEKITFRDLANFLNQMRTRSTEATDSLLNFFKPAQGENSPLLPPPKDDSAEGQIFQNASSEDLKLFNKIIQILKTAPEE